jgi:ubiquinone/menaquinone biosynthesis C-methylase UbiE
MFLRKTAGGRDPLPLAMSGVRMGERVLQIGVDDARLAGAIAARAGISGHAAMIVADEKAAGRARKGAEDSAALLDVQVGPPRALPYEPASFDVAIVHTVGGLIQALGPDERSAAFRECHRVLRAGGRLVVIEAGTPTGFSAFFRSGPPSGAEAADSATLAELERAGFRAPRLLADREGYRFIEGLKA